MLELEGSLRDREAERPHYIYEETGAQRGGESSLIFHPANQVASHSREDLASDTTVLQGVFSRRK